MNRRTLLTAATWTAPVVLTARTAPAYATSHTCSKACDPVVRCRRVKHPSGAEWWEYKAETDCPYTFLATDSWATREREDTRQVVWTRGRKTHARVVEVKRR